MIYIVAMISSFISGMGIGGGSAFILISLLFKLLDITQVRVYNLVMFISVGIGIWIKNSKRKKIIKDNLNVILYIILGCVFGLILNKFIDENLLKKSFYYFMLIIGIYEIIASLKRLKTDNNITKKGEN